MHSICKLINVGNLESQLKSNNLNNNERIVNRNINLLFRVY